MSLAAVESPEIALSTLDDLLTLSLEELGDIRVHVPGALTRLSPEKIPASIALITAEDIRYTPARNIYDLIEIYVPGGIWMNHEESPMLGEGNDLNNWPNQSVKVYWTEKIFNKTTAHIDAHYFWDYQGSKDGLESLRQSVQGEPEQAAVEQSLQRVADVKAYEYDFRLNASLGYKASKRMNVYIYVQNLLGGNGSKRYSYDNGNSRASPRRVRFVVEPRTYGVRMDYQF